MFNVQVYPRSEQWDSRAPTTSRVSLVRSRHLNQRRTVEKREEEIQKTKIRSNRRAADVAVAFAVGMLSAIQVLYDDIRSYPS